MKTWRLELGLLAIAFSAALSIGCGGDKSVDSPPVQHIVYSDTEAVHLGYQINRTFLLDMDIYNQIHRELLLIRDSFPDMTKVKHFENRPAGRILVQLTASAAAAYETGTYNGLDSLIRTYDTAKSTWTSQFRQLKLYFAKPYYPDSIATQFSQANGVDYCAAISIGGDSSRIFVDRPQYEFQLRWDNCLAGCDSVHYWHYIVSGDDVNLVADSGATLPPWFDL